jgi:hypothetical protein
VGLVWGLYWSFCSIVTFTELSNSIVTHKDHSTKN